MFLLSRNERNVAIDILNHAKCDRWKEVKSILQDPGQVVVHNNKRLLTYHDKTSPEPLLVLAARKGQDDIVKYLIEKHDIPIDCRGTENHRTALFVCANNRADIQMVKWLLQHGADPKIREVSPRNTFAKYDEDSPYAEYPPAFIYTSTLKRLFQLVLEGQEYEYSIENRFDSALRHYHNEDHVDIAYDDEGLVRRKKFTGRLTERKEIIKLLLKQKGGSIHRSDARLIKKYVIMLKDREITKAYDDRCSPTPAAGSGDNGDGRQRYSLRDAKTALRNENWDLLETILQKVKVTGRSSYQRKFIDEFVQALLDSNLSTPVIPLEKCNDLCVLVARHLRPYHAKGLHNFLQKFYKYRKNCEYVIPEERSKFLAPLIAKGAYLYQSNLWIRMFDHGHNAWSDRHRKPRRKKISLLQHAAQHGDHNLCRVIVENAPSLKSLLCYRGEPDRMAYQLVAASDHELRLYLQDALSRADNKNTK